MFLNAKMRPEVWLIVFSGNTEGQERFSTIMKWGLTLRYTQKDTSYILQRS